MEQCPHSDVVLCYLLVCTCSYVGSLTLHGVGRDTTLWTTEIEGHGGVGIAHYLMMDIYQDPRDMDLIVVDEDLMSSGAHVVH